MCSSSASNSFQLAGEVITRGRLPHWYVPGAIHFLTYRLAGTIPQSVLDRIREKNREIDWLVQPRVAAIIRENLYHHEAKNTTYSPIR